jgi:hypothetical protein
MNFSIEDAVAVLSRTPETLRQWLSGLPEEWIRGDEGPDTFSAWDVVGHLLHGEHADWIPRARRILVEGTAQPFEPFARRAHRTLYAGRSIDELLKELAGARAANLATLRAWGFDDRALDRRGLHPELGEVTLRQLLATWVVHDLGHIAQGARVMAKQYASEVGPWQAYLPVLHDRTPEASRQPGG